jgi:predicted metalloenzyme YecM
MDFELRTHFLDRLFENLEKVGIDVSGLEMDHIAYKTSSEKEYFELKPDFLKIGSLVKESMVRERRVGIFELNKPWYYKNYKVSAVELIAPKVGEIIKSGFEHAEFVLNESYESFMGKVPKINWDTSVMNSDLFSMIKLRLTEDMQVKFHQMPILEMVKKENTSN